MQSTLPRARVLHGIEQHGMLEQFSVLNHQIDACDVHMHNAASANVEMSDLAVAHLPLGQSDKRPTGMNERVGMLPQQAVVGRFTGKSNGVGFGFGSVSPAVENSENEWFRTGHKAASSS